MKHDKHNLEPSELRPGDVVTVVHKNLNEYLLKTYDFTFDVIRTAPDLPTRLGAVIRIKRSGAVDYARVGWVYELVDVEQWSSTDGEAYDPAGVAGMVADNDGFEVLSEGLA